MQGSTQYPTDLIEMYLVLLKGSNASGAVECLYEGIHTDGAQHSPVSCRGEQGNHHQRAMALWARGSGCAVEVQIIMII